MQNKHCTPSHNPGRGSQWLKISFALLTLFLFSGNITDKAYCQTRQPITPLKGGEKILWVGNSYSSFYGPTQEAVNALLVASNPSITGVQFTAKGKGMGIVLEYATWSSLGVINEIRKGGWTYVIIQGWEDAFYRWGADPLENGQPNPETVYGRDEAARIKSRDAMLANLKILDSEIKKVGAKTILFEPHVGTWNYLYEYPASQKTYSEMLPELNVAYAPVTWAWNQVKADYPTTTYACKGDNSTGFIKMLYSDCGHQNWTGTALDAYTFYTMFTGKSAVGLNPSHAVFTNMDATYKDYLAGVGFTIGKQIIDLNASSDNVAPSAPTNVQTSSITASSATISWSASTDNVGVTSYEVFAGPTSKGTTTSTSLNITGLAAATTYSITVRAKDAAGNVSAASTAKSLTTSSSTDNAAPSVPASLASSNVTPSSFTLSWAASTDNVGVTGYDIYRGTTLAGSSTSTSFTVTGLSASTAYSMTVRAKDAAGNTSAASAALSVTTAAPDTQAPTVPANLTATSVTDVGFTLNWSAASDNVGVSKYDVYMDGNLYGNTVNAETNMPIPFLTPSTSYTMTVRARDAAGNVSAQSAPLTVTTIAGSSLRNPENPANTVAGLEYNYYEGTGWSVLPTFSALTPVKSGNVTNVDLSVRNREDNFGFSFTGYVNIPTDGTYTFYTSSDDGSKLYIGSTEVVNNDGLHAMEERSGAIALKAGKHAITVNFFENTGGEGLTVSYSGPGITKGVIPATALFRTTTASNTVTREYWSNITGTAVSAIPVSTTPSGTSEISSLEGPSNWGDNYGTRIRAFIKPSTSGSYTFYLAGDDDAELWLSTDATPTNKVRIANVSGWTGSREWNKYPSQTSAARTLTANTNYYIEILHKEATGGDNIAVAWTGPGMATPTVIGSPNLEKYTDTPSGNFNGTYRLTARHSGKALDVNQSSTVDGANVQQWTSNGSTAQQWIITATSDGYYRLICKASGKALEVGSNSLSDGGNVQQWGYVGANSQQWKIEATTDGHYRLLNRNSGKALDVAEGSSTDGANVHQWAYGGGTNQQWKLDLLSTATTRQGEAQVSLAGVSVYPNPASDKVTLSVKAASEQNLQVVITDVVAKTRGSKKALLKTGTNLIELNTTSLENGVYFIRVLANGKTTTHKLVITK